MTTTTPERIHHGSPLSANASRARLMARTVWLWPALLTLALGVRSSWRPQLWRDELATWSAATRSTGELVHLLGHVDAVSGTYYLLMHFWIGVAGDSPAMLRLPSALAMAGAAVFVVLAARQLFDTRTALISGLLFAVIPSVSRYAQETRSYAFVVLAVSAATWLLLRALERPTPLRWLPYAIAVATAGLFHLVSLAFLAAHLVIVVMRWRLDRDRRLLVGYPVTVVIGLLPLAPLVVLGQHQAGRQISWLASPDLNTFVDFWHGLFGSSLVSGCLLALAAIPAGWSRGRRPALEIGLVAVLPIMLTWFASQGHTAYFFNRYQLYTVPAWAVLAGVGLSSLRPRVLTAAGLILVTLLGIPDQQQIRTSSSHEWTNGKGAAQIIADGYRPGDGFVPVRGDFRYMMFDLEIDYYLPRDVQLRDVFATRTAVQRGDFYPSECERPADCLAGTNRIWVVTTGSGKDPYQNLPADQAAALRAAYTPVEVKHVRGLTVSLVAQRR